MNYSDIIHHIPLASSGETSGSIAPRFLGADDIKRIREDPIRNLVKAGALIAAEIDRLQRAKEKK